MAYIQQLRGCRACMLCPIWLRGICRCLRADAAWLMAASCLEEPSVRWCAPHAPCGPAFVLLSAANSHFSCLSQAAHRQDWLRAPGLSGARTLVSLAQPPPPAHACIIMRCHARPHAGISQQEAAILPGVQGRRRHARRACTRSPWQHSRVQARRGHAQHPPCRETRP